jgi:hypothetical protein
MRLPGGATVRVRPLVRQVPAGDETRTCVPTPACETDRRRGCARRLPTCVPEHPDGESLLSLFRGPYSVVTAATLPVEIGDYRPRYPTGDALAGGGAGKEAVTKGEVAAPSRGGRWDPTLRASAKRPRAGPRSCSAIRKQQPKRCADGLQLLSGESAIDACGEFCFPWEAVAQTTP